MKASEVLMKAKALIGTPDRWLKGALNNGRGGFCALGAMIGATGTWSPGDAGPYFRLAATGSEDGSIARWNNAPERTHAEVMAAFDRAIALALADERKDEPWTIEDTRKVIAEITHQHVHTLDELNA